MKDIGRHLAGMGLMAVCCVQPERASGATDWPEVMTSAVRVANQVAECLELRPREVAQIGPMVTLVVDARIKDSVGRCGCTSALLAYQVLEDVEVQPDGSARYERAYGLVSAAPGNGGAARTFHFVLSSDAEVHFALPLILTVACKAPD